MIRYFPLGDSALQLTFGDAIQEGTHRQITAFVRKLEAAAIPAVQEVVPAYTQVLVHYDPLQLGIHELVEQIRQLEQTADTTTGDRSGLIEIPVCYAPDFAPDLETVCLTSGKSRDEVVRLHSEAIYKVYLLGFTPGFCYLGGLPAAIATPRKANPSPKILAGSVGIAAEQTGIYPIESPGGWQIIGRTPLKLFSPDKANPFLLTAGDRVRFCPIGIDEFNRLNEYDD